MKDERILEKIEQLLQSKQSENNYLALTLMRTQLGLPFREAFSKLSMRQLQEPSIYGWSKYVIEILDYHIYYTLEHRWASKNEYPFLEIRRLVQHKNKAIKHLKMYFVIDFFESEKERDMLEAMLALPNLGEGLDELFYI